MLPREDVDAPSLEVTKNRLDGDLLMEGALVHSKGVELSDL